MRDEKIRTLLALSFAVITPAAVADQSSVELPAVEIVEGHPIRTVLPPDAIPALDDPPRVAGTEADFMEAGEPVLGVVVAGEARAYPLALLDWHEVVNDRLGGLPIAATW